MVINKTVTYDYDYVGNITSVKTYAYTTGTLGTPLTNQNYTYNSQNQRTDLSYDANGNMTEHNGYTFGWTNRRLTSATSTDNSISYTYNYDGIRTSKTINGITTYYEIDENNNVVKQYELVDGVETNVIEFVYDSNGSPIYFTYNNATYYYEKNLQGDIVGILDANGNTVVEYSYDIWGKLLGITGTLADTIGAINPLRYRGYYYDTETGLYYLQSRYYSPELMRFISQDDPVFSNAQGEPLGSNLYVYCGNDCVNSVDYFGCAATKIYAFKFTYDRSKAISYAEKWYRSYNKMYYKYSEDCANFVSQCLFAGGVFMTISSNGWYSLRKEQKGFNLKKLLSIFSYKYKYQWDVGPAWRVAEKQYQYFKNSEYANKIFSITSESDISKKLNKYTIKKGDLMYFDYRGNSDKDHATMISKVTDKEIFYTAHTVARFNENLKKVFKSKKKLKVYIITIKDSI